MRLRLERRARKRMRIAHPEFARRRGRTPRLEQTLLAITNDRNAPVEDRRIAAELLDVGGHRDPYRPLIEHFLDCDAETAWNLATFAFPVLRLTHWDEARVSRLLREHPEEQRRAATAYFLWTVETSATMRRVLMESFEDRSETEHVRGIAAEALAHQGGREAFEACVRQLRDPDAAVRFWAVFAIGQLAFMKASLHERAIGALEPMVDDAGLHPAFWSVGYEARAMLEYFVSEVRRRGEEERSAILADADVAPELKRWAEFYSHAAMAAVPGPCTREVEMHGR